MRKTKIQQEVTIDAPSQKVWEVLADFGNIADSSPGVVKSYLTSKRKTGVGTSRHCDLKKMGAQVEERIISWKDGASMKIDIYERKHLPMITDTIAEFSIKSEGKVTILRGTFEYGMSGILGTIMNALMMKRMNRKLWTTVLAGFKYHTETGEKVDSKTILPIGSVREFTEE